MADVGWRASRGMCLGCGGPQRCGSVRGNCSSCYGKLRGRVRRGSTTWEELEAKGLVAPARPKIGRKMSAYQSAVREALRKERQTDEQA